MARRTLRFGAQVNALPGPTAPSSQPANRVSQDAMRLSYTVAQLTPLIGQYDRCVVVVRDLNGLNAEWRVGDQTAANGTTVIGNTLAGRWFVLSGGSAGSTLSSTVPLPTAAASSNGSEAASAKGDHTHKTVLNTLLASALSSRPGEVDGELVITSGQAAQGDGCSATFRFASGVSSGADGFNKINAANGQWQRTSTSGISTRSGNYTLVQADERRGLLEFTDATPVTVTVPSLAKGTIIEIAQYGAGQVRLVFSGVTPIAPKGTKTDAQGGVLRLVYRSTTEVYVRGDVTTVDLPANPPPGEPPPTPPPTPSAGILQPGNMYWGACGHLDQGGPYASVPAATQAAYLKNIFGSTPNTILYRAFGDSQNNTDINTTVRAFQALDIIPMVMVITYPDWNGLANEAAAYSWAYSTVTATCNAAPTIQVFNIGNEWNLQVAQPGGNDGESPSDWTGLSFYPKFRGALAGATAAIRDRLPNAQIIAPAGAGWIKVGFAKALLDDMRSYNGRNLSPDYTDLHWYNGPGGVNQFGMPDNLNNPSGANVYALMKPATATPKPIIATEFGASSGGSTDAAAAAAITALMDNFLAHKNGSATELGVAGGTIYELFSTAAFPDYKLYAYSSGATATIAAQGTAVKNWIAANAGGGGGGGTPSGTWVPIDDASSSITYTGTWQAHSSGFQESQTALAEAQFTFTGTGVRYYCKVAPYLTGQIAIYIDNVLQTTQSNLRSAENNSFLLYENTSLSNASHTIRVRLASGNWISIDKFEYRTP